MTPTTAFGPMIKVGMKAIGPMKICTTLMNMDISREKEKGKGKKGKQGKDDDGKGVKPGDRKGKFNYVQPQTSSTPAVQNQQQRKLTTLLQHQALVMVSLHLQRQNQHMWMF